LGTLESSFEQMADVLGMGKIESGIDLIKDIHGRRLELKKSHDERQGDQRTV